MRSSEASLIAIAAFAGMLGVPRDARAAPQANFGLTVGGGATDLRTDGPRAAFHLGARADVLFLRTRNRGMAVGPYVDVATAAFDTIEVGGGAEWLLPVTEGFPLVVSAGLLERRAKIFGWEPAAESTIFFGWRGYNYGSWYGLATGLFVQARYGFGGGKQTDLIAGAQLDLSLFAYPFLLAYEALRR